MQGSAAKSSSTAVFTGLAPFVSIVARGAVRVKGLRPPGPPGWLRPPRGVVYYEVEDVAAVAAVFER